MSERRWRVWDALDPAYCQVFVAHTNGQARAMAYRLLRELGHTSVRFVDLRCVLEQEADHE